MTGTDHLPPQAFVPPPPERRSLNPVWLIAAVVALPVVAALVIGALFVATGSERSDRVVEIEWSGTEPEADLLVALTPAGQTGAAVEAMLADSVLDHMGADGTLVPGSAVLVASAETRFGRTDLLRWSVESAGQKFDCFGSISDGGSSSACGNPGTDPSVSWGALESSAGTIFDVSVANLPEDAAWLVTSTWGDGFIASPVVDGMSFQQWPPNLKGNGVIADARAVAALNSDLEVIWQQSR